MGFHREADTAGFGVRAQAATRITAPPGTKFELVGCYGRRKGPRGWRRMRGNSWFDIR